MATAEITQLPLTLGMDGTEQVEIVQGGVSMRGTTAQIAALATGLVTLPQNANTFYAGPAAGVAATPGFRSMVSADLPVSGVAAGSYGSALNYPVITVDAAGRITAATNQSLPAGSVTSVGLAAPAEFSVSGSPVTGTGTLTLAWNAPVTAIHGGTGLALYAIGDVLYANSTTTLARLADIATGSVLISGGVNTAPSWGKVGLTTHISGTLGVGNGGTGIVTGISGGILGFTSTGTLASSVALTANAIVLGGGAGATPTVLGTLGTTTTVLHGNAAGAPTFSSVALTTDVSGVLPSANGGTGTGTYVIGDILYASSTTALSRLADVATGNVLISGGVGVAPSYGKVGLGTHVTGILAGGNGGTGLGSGYAVGDLLVASGAATLVRLPDVATGNVLRSQGVGVAPAYGKVNLATDVTGILPKANSQGNVDYQVFTASGNWIKPAGATGNELVIMEEWGAGGSGSSGANASGGGGGSYNRAEFLCSDLASSEPVTVGIGGGSVTGVNVGNAGSPSAFHGIFAYGGNGAVASNNGGGGGGIAGNAVGVTGGAPTNSSGVLGGADGSAAGAAGNSNVYYGGGGGSGGGGGGPNSGGNAVFGGGGGGAHTSATVGAGGTSQKGGNGGAGVNGVGGAGVAPGGGGGGAAVANPSGAGARGEVRIWTIG